MHKLLKRQITELLGNNYQTSAELESFINAIDTAYKNFESDRKLHENNLDLTSKEITEEIQLANDEAKTKSLFLANRSYEIRTPLSGVLGMLQLLAETNLKAEQLDYLNIASTSALSLLSIINDLLDYYKMEAGVLELEFVEFNFLEWFETTLKIMDVHALNKEQELVGAIITAVPKTLIGDPIRLRQVLINLINNAIKFTEPKGGIIVCVEHLELDGKLLNLSFSVSDSGVGVAADKAESIFKAFVQQDSSITRKYGGTGLGLSICQGIVERMGGELWFKSKNKIGTAFHFNVILEYDINDLINLEAENLLSRQLSQLSALIVSADELSCAHYSNALKNWGMKVESISTLNNLNLSKHYDILVVNLIIDLTTPEELQIEKFKNEITSLQKDLPILVITPNYLSQFDQLLKKVKFKHLKRGDTFGKLLDSLLFVLANKNVTSHSLNLEHHNNSELNNEQKTILIVEDNLINQKVASKTLLSRGYHVLIADNGKLAIDALDNNSIDLVLMDLEMPIMGGLEAVQIIRSSSTNYKSVPVIALTAHAMESTKSKCIESGMNDFLAKPFKLNELIETIEANLFNESE